MAPCGFLRGPSRSFYGPLVEGVTPDASRESRLTSLAFRLFRLARLTWHARTVARVVGLLRGWGNRLARCDPRGLPVRVALVDSPGAVQKGRNHAGHREGNHSLAA